MYAYNPITNELVKSKSKKAIKSFIRRSAVAVTYDKHPSLQALDKARKKFSSLSA
jgi:hypothetical protein